MKKQVVGLMTVAIMCLFFGCGKEEKVDYSINGIEEAPGTEGNIGKSEVSQFEDETSWNETWIIEEGVEEAVQVTVDAEIILPGTEEMSVVEVVVPEFDATYKEKLLNRMFDAWHIPEENPDGQSEEYEMDRYIGNRDGTMFQMFFYQQVNSQGFVYAAKDFKDVCPTQYEGYTTYMEHSYVMDAEATNAMENECGLSMVDAEKLAREFVEELGLEYPILAYTSPLLWGDDSMSAENAYNWPANGYVFQFEYGVENTPLSGYGKEGEYTNFVNGESGEESQYSMTGELSVYVTDKGVIQMNVYCPVETVSVTERVKLLPLDAIKAIMIEQTKTRYKQFRFSHGVRNTDLSFTHMELIYFRVGDKENPGYYSYIPAWRLSEQSGSKEADNRTIKNAVIVNAIDGSLINFYEET